MPAPMTQEQLNKVKEMWAECAKDPPEALTGLPQIDNPIKLSQATPLLLAEIERLRAPEDRGKLLKRAIRRSIVLSHVCGLVLALLAIQAPSVLAYVFPLFFWTELLRSWGDSQ